MLKPPVWALISSTSPAKWRPGTSLLSRVLGLISLRLTPPLVTKDLARDIFTSHRNFEGLDRLEKLFAFLFSQLFDFFRIALHKILPSVLATKFSRHFSRIFPGFLLEMQPSHSQKVEAKHPVRELPTLDKTRHTQGSRTRQTKVGKSRS